jgi:hypothetical protein
VTGVPGIADIGNRKLWGWRMSLEISFDIGFVIIYVQYNCLRFLSLVFVVSLERIDCFPAAYFTGRVNCKC